MTSTSLGPGAEPEGRHSGSRNAATGPAAGPTTAPVTGTAAAPPALDGARAGIPRPRRRPEGAKRRGVDSGGPGPGRGLPYLPGLDGLRALAVIGVLLYHAGLAAVPGGFLGVEIFFVLSGFLITSLLLSEWRAQGRIDLRHFWMARARRLLPALFAVLAVTSAVAVVFYREEVAELRGALLAALTYTSNWYLIFTEQSYFEASGRPSALEHLWSLAVEEQFYLVWPLVFMAVIARFGLKRLALVTVLGVAASTALMIALYVPGEDPSRVYMGTDTRAAGLLVGAALAYVWVPGRLRRTGRRGPSVILNGAGLLCLAGLVGFMALVSEYDTALFQGGFLVVALVSAGTIAAAVHPDARLLGRYVLGNAVVVWIGRRAYGIYLWHWPVFVVTRPDVDTGLSSGPLLALRLGLTLALAAASYRFLEQPIRTRIGRASTAQAGSATPRRLRWRPDPRWATITVLTCLAVGATLVVSASPVPVPSQNQGVVAATPAVADGEQGSAEAAPRAVMLPGMREVIPGQPEGLPVALRGWRPGGTSAAAAVEAASAWAPLPGHLGKVGAVGDSVMVAAAPTLRDMFGGGAPVNADIGRQWNDGIRVATSMDRRGVLGDTVVVHLGSNGAITADQVDSMMEALAEARYVVFVNTKVPRRWESVTNEALADGVARHANVELADWHAAAAPELLEGDGIHLRGSDGVRAYANAIREALLRL